MCSQQSSLSLFAAPHFIAFPHVYLYTRCAFLTVSHSLRRLFLIFSLLCISFNKMNISALYRINFSLSLSLTVGPGRERPLRWGISVHREPPRAAPSSRENRGHRRLTAPLLPVSRLITACHTCTITHTHTYGHVGKCIRARNPAHWVTFLFHSVPYVLIRMWKAHQRDLSSSARVGGVGCLYACV